MDHALAATAEVRSEIEELQERIKELEAELGRSLAGRSGRTLDDLVRDRTMELELANEMLWKEVLDQKKTIQSLEKANEMLWRECVSLERDANLKAREIQSLRQSLSEARVLSGILCVCFGCRKIRDEHGQWQPLEKYIEERTDARFSHGICQECRDRMYPEMRQPE